MKLYWNIHCMKYESRQNWTRCAELFAVGTTTKANVLTRKHFYASVSASHRYRIYNLHYFNSRIYSTLWRLLNQIAFVRRIESFNWVIQHAVSIIRATRIQSVNMNWPLNWTRLGNRNMYVAQWRHSWELFRDLKSLRQSSKGGKSIKWQLTIIRRSGGE